MKLRLHFSPASPFVRKVRVFADEAGLAELLDCVPTDVWGTASASFAENPLAKVPALIGPDGAFLNSLMCCEYLDTLHSGRRLIPVEPAARWPVLRLHALADGMTEATVAHVIEALRRPPEYVYAGYLERQLQRIGRALDVLEAMAPDFGEELDLGTIALACGLSYLDFRLPELDWRSARPSLARWEAVVAARPSLVATRPHV